MWLLGDATMSCGQRPLGNDGDEGEGVGELGQSVQNFFGTADQIDAPNVSLVPKKHLLLKT
jgi:hypothetical protein